MAKQYVVKALVALVNSEGGYAQLMHRGSVLPSNADPVQLQHMLDNDLVVEGEAVGGLAPVMTGDGQTVLTHPSPSGGGPANESAKAAAKPGPGAKDSS